jgi:hypothetical protein
MKKIMQASALILLTAAIVFAAASSDDKNNETCYDEWTMFQSSNQSTVAQSAIDSHEHSQNRQ